MHCQACAGFWSGLTWPRGIFERFHLAECETRLCLHAREFCQNVLLRLHRHARLFQLLNFASQLSTFASHLRSVAALDPWMWRQNHAQQQVRSSTAKQRYLLGYEQVFRLVNSCLSSCTLLPTASCVLSCGVDLRSEHLCCQIPGTNKCLYPLFVPSFPPPMSRWVVCVSWILLWSIMKGKKKSLLPICLLSLIFRFILNWSKPFRWDMDPYEYARFYIFLFYPYFSFVPYFPFCCELTWTNQMRKWTVWIYTVRGSRTVLGYFRSTKEEWFEMPVRQFNMNP